MAQRPNRKRQFESLNECDPLWYKDAIIYELHVRAFYDASGDGTGDFQGLTQKLDYLHELGVTAIWLLPFYASPLRDDGYDISDYRKVHPMYGTLKDFRRFLEKAHSHGLRVITELVLNHTSDQHAWFERARHAPAGSPYRDYYVWSDSGTEYPAARVIFKDFERSNWTWDPLAKAYFWHRFYSHQPDLNYDNPELRREMLDIVDFWLEQGVDGFRLDGVPYLYEREGSDCENLPETHAFLKELRAHIDRSFPGTVLLAEANQWPEDAAHYFGDGDECHMAYHFPLMPRLFMAARMEDRFPVTEILDETPPVPDNCQWALFLRNHDELTLEMVTDEERDYMYRVYANDDTARINLGIRRRLAPLLAHNRRLIELMNALIFSLRGTPVVYYGDELGMGDNVYLGDRNGVRTPMQWSADRNAGFSRANPHQLYLPVIVDPEYHYESVNAEAQQANPGLLLWWMKRLIGLRKRHAAFSRGSMRFVDSDNRRILAFVRETGDETILVAANLSRFSQAAELSLSAFAGRVPVEMFGSARFPEVTEAAYFLSFGPHAFYWFLLEPLATAEKRSVAPATELSLRNSDCWDGWLSGRGRQEFEAVLAAYVPQRRWYAGKARRMRNLSITETFPLGRRGGPPAVLVLVTVEYLDGEPEQYSLVIAAESLERAMEIARDTPWAIILKLKTAGGPLVLVDGLAVPEVTKSLLTHFRSRRLVRGHHRSLRFTAYESTAGWDRDADGALAPAVFKGEQTNTTVAYGHSLMLKAIRKFDYGQHPQVELERFLGSTPAASLVPRVAGAIHLVDSGGRTALLGILEHMIPHQFDAWAFALEELRRLFEDVSVRRLDAPPFPPIVHHLDTLPVAIPPPLAGGWQDFAYELGCRTADLHVALARAPEGADMAPEFYNPFVQRAVAEGFRAHARRTFRLLRLSAPHLSSPGAELANSVIGLEDPLLRRLKLVGSRPLQSPRIRIHGDFHLGQVLLSGRGIAFIDFEGEPERSLGERRVKSSAWRDLASMIRSFDYASRVALRDLDDALASAQTHPGQFEAWARAWYAFSVRRFLDGYLESTGRGDIDLTGEPDEQRLLFDAYLFDKALYELAYELNNRPEWVETPLRGILAAADAALTGAPAG